MNRYAEMSRRHQGEVNEFPLGAAFSDKQFEEMMAKWGLTTSEEDLKKILSLGYGCYIRKADEPQYTEMAQRHNKELEEAIASDTTGDGFVLEMFLYELRNHEYGYTGEVDETLDALGYSIEDIMANEALSYGLAKACEIVMKEED